MTGSEGNSEAWLLIDAHIVAGRQIEALAAIRRAMGGSVGEALVVFRRRYLALRDTRPKDFESDDEEYWRGFES